MLDESSSDRYKGKETITSHVDNNCIKQLGVLLTWQTSDNFFFQGLFKNPQAVVFLRITQNFSG